MEPLLGEVKTFAGNFAPNGWALCDGQLLSINQNQALFSILGTTYGGDGRTNFALPKMRANSLMTDWLGEDDSTTVKFIIALVGIYPTRD